MSNPPKCSSCQSEKVQTEHGKWVCYNIACPTYGQ